MRNRALQVLDFFFIFHSLLNIILSSASSSPICAGHPVRRQVGMDAHREREREREIACLRTVPPERYAYFFPNGLQTSPTPARVETRGSCRTFCPEACAAVRV